MSKNDLKYSNRNRLIHWECDPALPLQLIHRIINFSYISKPSYALKIQNRYRFESKQEVTCQNCKHSHVKMSVRRLSKIFNMDCQAKKIKWISCFIVVAFSAMLTFGREEEPPRFNVMSQGSPIFEVIRPRWEIFFNTWILPFILHSILLSYLCFCMPADKSRKWPTLHLDQVEEKITGNLFFRNSCKLGRKFTEL